MFPRIASMASDSASGYSWSAKLDELNCSVEEVFLPPLLSMVRRIALVTCLITRLVICLVHVFFEVPLFGVVTVMCNVIAPVAHPLLVVLIFGIILIVMVLC